MFNNKIIWISSFWRYGKICIIKNHLFKPHKRENSPENRVISGIKTQAQEWAWKATGWILFILILWMHNKERENLGSYFFIVGFFPPRKKTFSVILKSAAEKLTTDKSRSCFFVHFTLNSVIGKKQFSFSFFSKSIFLSFSSQQFELCAWELSTSVFNTHTKNVGFWANGQCLC